VRRDFGIEELGQAIGGRSLGVQNDPQRGHDLRDGHVGEQTEAPVAGDVRGVVAGPRLAAVDGGIAAPDDEVAIPTAIMAGATTSRDPVISATIKMTAIGAREMLPKQAIMPTITKVAGSWGMPGAKGSSRRQTPAPRNPPMTRPGPKIPPEPPEPMDSPVARIRANGSRSTMTSDIWRRLERPRVTWTHP